MRKKCKNLGKSSACGGSFLSPLRARAASPPGPVPAIPPQQPLVMNGRSGLTTSDDDTVLRILYIAGPCAFRH